MKASQHQNPVIEPLQVETASIRVARDNDYLYDKFSMANNDDRALCESIATLGVLEPLVLSEDRYLLSGHRRLACAKQIGLTIVPARIASHRFGSLDDGERLNLLSEFNRQREKSSDEVIREAIARVDPLMAQAEIRMLKFERSIHGKSVVNIDIGIKKQRAKITSHMFLLSAQNVINNNRQFWPLTVRRVHYLLLNAPPLRHDKKPGSAYRNDLASYKALSSLLTRARLNGQIPMLSIEDSTRPVLDGGGFSSVGEYVDHEMKYLFSGYTRDLQQGQPHHIEIILEKNALRTVISEVAEEFGIPLTVSRGYLSLPPKAEIVSRYRKSGKARLVLLFLTDFDPDGEEIAASTARSLRDDFGIKEIHPVKVALTADDVNENDLPSDMDAKPSSPQYKKFLQQYGTDRAVELDAAPVEMLQEKLREAVLENLDLEEFNRQLEIQYNDNVHLVAYKNIIVNSLALQK